MLDFQGMQADVAAAAVRLSEQLCGTRMVFDTAWFVQEFDALALALRGSYKEHEARLGGSVGACSRRPRKGRLAET